MRSEARFLLAIVLMLAVLVGTNLLFAPPPVDEVEDTDPSADAPAQVEEEAPPPQDADVPDTPPADTPVADPDADQPPTLPELDEQEDPPELPEEAMEGPERILEVNSPLYRFEFSTRGARIRSAELLSYESFTRTGPVQLVTADGPGFLGHRLVLGADTVDLRNLSFRVEPDVQSLDLEEGDDPATLRFVYEHPTEPFVFEVRYTFDPAQYIIGVEGRVRGYERGLLVTDLGRGLAYNEADVSDDRRALEWVVNHLQDGIDRDGIAGMEARQSRDGPFHWAAVKSRYFLVAMLPTGVEGSTRYLGGLVADPAQVDDDETADVTVSQSVGSGGTFAYRFLVGPQDHAMLQALGNDLEQVNPVGWAFLRPILRPFVNAVTWLLVFLHDFLSIGYGWVLILFGILMRVVLFPLYHKAMKAQLRNMAVQPLLKEIQTKYKDQPEKMQKELMKLYKEHGFNPLAGCWPMLLPFPILIALFFVFQNTIELRGVPFAWLPDLSARDPYFILPVLLGISMFFIQWISMRTLDEVPPQMKFMMWGLPVGMVVIFANFPSGLILYYLTANVATLPQSWWIANERQKVRSRQETETAAPAKA
ncbi:MAG: membrane protein insertase YidC [Gemmatimonadales bacterium]|nr:MAG: membrane protein insertase YidC [Gemmatimonadales bacterium]